MKIAKANQKGTPWTAKRQAKTGNTYHYQAKTGNTYHYHAKTKAL